MQILVVNSGSSSLKTSLFKVEGKKCARMQDLQIKGINSLSPSLVKRTLQKDEKEPLNSVKDIKGALDIILEKLKGLFTEIAAIGHRFVHGGDKYRTSVLINPSIRNDLEQLVALAPLHNPACLEGIKACENYFGEKMPQVVCFDTSFHRNMPLFASQYALPYDLALKYGIKRYGFHGIAHAFLWQAYELQTEKKDSKVITIHLGNGCSMAAIKAGVSLDTTMGFTPDEGLVMATRAGDLDPAIVEFLCVHENKTPSEVTHLLNHSSGLLGVSGVSSDMKRVLGAVNKDKRAALAVDIFCYRIVKYLGAYLAILGGAEAIIFSGGIGENSSE